MQLRVLVIAQMDKRFVGNPRTRRILCNGRVVVAREVPKPQTGHG